ncbi:DUF971 domain-containing protein [Bacteroidetes/Chlorobi group bacterium ChocPot_Mid]|jgi:DUF971 family protein|nr:MAG: DUF971 domain-containing protein [Bacteroidetes/Chlorobi group bacterium ChocPot_Mid]
MAVPKKIKLVKDELLIVWDNGKENYFPLKFLRDESPDATNKGETILWKHYPATEKQSEVNRPGKYEIEKIVPVGNYGIQITWKDGYDYGIYSWDLFEKWADFLDIKRSLREFDKNNHGQEN